MDTALEPRTFGAGARLAFRSLADRGKGRGHRALCRLPERGRLVLQSLAGVRVYDRDGCGNRQRRRLAERPGRALSDPADPLAEGRLGVGERLAVGQSLADRLDDAARGEFSMVQRVVRFDRAE